LDLEFKLISIAPGKDLPPDLFVTFQAWPLGFGRAGRALTIGARKS
jgi:hypothetical protein